MHGWEVKGVLNCVTVKKTANVKQNRATHDDSRELGGKQ
jgi:hypothetical protein